MPFPWFSRSGRTQPKPLLQVPFVGREDLVAELERCLQAATAGSVQCVTLAGAAGSGKTSILDEFVLLHCTRPRVLLLRLNVAAYVIEQEFYQALLTTLRERSEHVLRTVYKDTRGVRKHLGLTWDEKEFTQMLASTDWAPIQAELRDAPKRSSPLASLFLSVQQFPWAVGAAIVLDSMARGTAGGNTSRPWTQRWQDVMHTLCTRAYADDTVLVLVIDQLHAATHDVLATERLWTGVWRDFMTVTLGEARRLLLLWGGTPEGLRPVHEALHDTERLTRLQVEPLPAAEWQQLQTQVARRLPRRVRTAWQQYAQTHKTPAPPDMLLLAAAWVGMASATGAGAAPAGQEQTDETAPVAGLIQAIAQRHAALHALLPRVFEAWAFLPPDTPFVVEDLLPLCDLAALQLAPVAGRTGIETLLAAGVRYGLLRYDTYVTRYTAGHSRIQEAMQRYVYPDAAERLRMARRWQYTTTLLAHIRRGERALLRDLAERCAAESDVAEQRALATMLGAVFRRLLPACDKTERQRMAFALGDFSSPMAVDMLLTLLQDEDGQVRSGAVQSLADLQSAVTLPALIEALRDNNSDVRWIATQALGRIPGAATVDALIPMLTDDDKEVGRIAAQGLATQGDRRAVPHLIAAMREGYPLLRESAALALGQLADKRAVPALQELLQDTNPQVRRSAETALERLAASSV